MMRRWQAMACGAAGIAVVATLFCPPVWQRAIRGQNDFQVSYVSGQLVMRRQIYDTAVFQATERAILGQTNADLVDTRPPFLALIFWPLAHARLKRSYASRSFMHACDRVKSPAHADA